MSPQRIGINRMSQRVRAVTGLQIRRLLLQAPPQGRWLPMACAALATARRACHCR
jgi:hypothetical protein